jgi:hypothetical protein
MYGCRGWGNYDAVIAKEFNETMAVAAGAHIDDTTEATPECVHEPFGWVSVRFCCCRPQTGFVG